MADPAAAPVSKRTPLHDRHVAARAKLVDFAGWEMPVQYPSGIRGEHLAVREHAGVFDVSHMGEIETLGADAGPFLQHMLSNDVDAIGRGAAQYSVLCRHDGGVLDDLFTYRLGAERLLTVTNASNHSRDIAWLREHAAAGSWDVELRDALEDYAMLAVQGPAARSLLEPLGAGAPLPARMRCAEIALQGIDVLACGTGYTGEDGLELLVAPAQAPALWDAVVAAGATPAGLAARDTLRLEACFHLYGNDLMESRGPIEAGLGWCCKEQTGFVGAEAVAAVRERGPRERLVAFAIEGPGIARQGNPVVGGGEVTSGSLSPSLGIGIGMAYVPAERAAEGTALQIDVRGRLRDAVIRARPLYRRSER
ncbi:MAG: glycine cleavage system aminomethyltransferase GcvT [Solirubrobacteraceae bacterium]|nr:MAG: glycine cleavage system aminomethyltransferase GcvT [Solirubrobacterales bacterium]